jgi:hypothetical protein
MDRQTDGHGETSIPPYNCVAGGYNNNTEKISLVSKRKE